MMLIHSSTVVLLIICSVVDGNKTRLLLGEILCDNDEAKLGPFMTAVLTQMNLLSGVDLQVRSFSIRSKLSNQLEAERFMNNVKGLLDDNGTALVGCWVPDTELVLPPRFPYFVTNEQFPDFLEQRLSDQVVSRRWMRPNVTTLTPPINAIVRPILELIHRDYNEVVVIVFGAEGQIHFGDGLRNDYAGTDKMVIQYERLTQGGHRNILPALVRLRMRGIRNIVLHGGNLKAIRNILKEAMNLNMLTHDYDWYLTYPDTEGFLLQYPNLKAELKRSANFIGPQLIDRSTFAKYSLQYNTANIIHQSILLDAAIIVSKAVQAQPSPPNVLHDGLLRDYITGPFTREIFSGALGNYGNLTLLPSSAEGQLVSRVSCNVTWQGFRHGRYSSKAGYSATTIEFIRSTYVNETRMKSSVYLADLGEANYNRKKYPYFNEDEIVVVAKVEPPLVMYNSSEPNPKKQFSGVMIELMELYAKALNFRYRVIPAERMEHIRPSSTKSSRDLTIIDYLNTGQADLAIGGFSSNLQRNELVSFTETTIPCAWSLLMKPPSLQYSIFQFVTPFNESMWASIFIVFIVISILLAVMDFLDWTDANFPVRDSFYYVAGVLLSGTTETNPSSFPSRIMVGCFIFFSIVTFQSYTANMAAFLTTRDQFQGYPKTLYDVAKRTPMNVLLINGSEVASMLARAHKDPYNQVMAKAIQVNSYEEALTRIKEGHSVLVSDTSFTEYYTAQDCNLMDREQEADMIRYAMAVPLGAKYLDAINEAISSVKKAEVDRAVFKKWYTQPDCQLDRSNPENQQTKSLTMTEMLGIFLTLGVGFILSFCTAVVGELLVRFFWKKPGTRFWGGTRDYIAAIPRRLQRVFSVYRTAAAARGRKTNTRTSANGK